MENAPQHEAAAQQNAHADNAASATVTNRRTDDKYAPPFFHGKSSEDASEYVAYLERYAVYKHLSDGEILELLPVLLRDAASDFCDTLGDEQKSSWPNFKAAFLDRFGRSTVQRWKDTNALWTQIQGTQESADDFVSRLTRLAKHLPSLDPSTLQCAVTRGLKPHIRQHVLQADAKSMTELLQAARIAEMATPSTDASVSAVLDELRATSAQHTAAFQQLSTRLDKLSVTTIDQRHDDASSRRLSPRRVRFDNRRTRSPSPGLRRYNHNDDRRPPTTPTYRRPPFGNNYGQLDAATNRSCQRCGKQHTYRNCPAINATCTYCNVRGHFRAVCRAARKGNGRGRI